MHRLYQRVILNGFLLGILFLPPILFAQQEESDIILQGFYWNTHPGDLSSNEGIWWDTLATVAEDLAGAGFGTVWTPPPSKGFAGVFDMGYGVYDYFDLGDLYQKGTLRTRHGNRAQLEAMITALHAAGLRVMADVVLNHRGGAENQQPEDCDIDGPGGREPESRFTEFRPGSGRLPMDAPAFHPNSFPGHCDLNEPFHSRVFFEDLCYFNFLDEVLDATDVDQQGWFFGSHRLGDVGDSLVVWGRWLINDIGFDEIRLDAVKHIEPGFMAPFLVELANGPQPFAVGEFFDGNMDLVKEWHDDVEQFNLTFGAGSKNANIAMFDFNLRYALRDMANDLSGDFDMWQLNFRGLRFNPAGPLDAQDIVTFVENHDTDRIGYRVVPCPGGDLQFGNTCLELFSDSGHDPVIFDKHLAYAYIMAAQGRPGVFWKDWFWFHLDEEIRWLIALRQATAHGNSSPVKDLNPFSSQGLIGDDLFALRRDGSGSGKDGAILMLNDDPSTTLEFFLDSPDGWQNCEAKDYSDAFMFQTTRVFGDGRALYKADGRNYAWYAPTGLYPHPPGEPGSSFDLGDHRGAKLHYLVLRAEDMSQFLINGVPIEPGDEIAVLRPGTLEAVGLGRIGQSFRWDGVHDMIIEVLGGSNVAEAKGGLLNGDPLQLAVFDRSSKRIEIATSLTFATAGSIFSFSARRPASRGGNEPFTLQTNAGSDYQVGGISQVVAFNSGPLTCNLSSAGAADYNDGWQDSDNDGSGFGAWELKTQKNDPASGGHFLSTSANNGNGDDNSDGDIDSNGRSWGLYANNGDVSEALRPFSSPLVPGSRFTLKLDNGFIDPGGTVGFGLQNAAGENLVEVFFIGGNNQYIVQDANGSNPTGLGFTDEGLEISFDLLTGDTYRIILKRLEGGLAALGGNIPNLSGGQVIYRVRLFNANAGSGPNHDVFFNSLEICLPPCDIINLWPPNHAYVTINAGNCPGSLSGNCNGIGEITGAYIRAVSSDESEDAPGPADGSSSADIIIAEDCQSVKLRRERLEGGNGRVYTIEWVVTPSNGAVRTAACRVEITASQGSSGSAFDDGPAYTVYGNCTNGQTLPEGSEKLFRNPGDVRVPQRYLLEQNYPNPFNPTTMIRFGIPLAGNVVLRIYNSGGQLIRTLFTGRLEAGYYQFSWNAKNDREVKVSSGIYIYRLRAGDFAQTRKMLLLK